MSLKRKLFRAVVIAAIAFCLLLLAIYVNHRFQTAKESELLLPLGDLVEVDGHKMSVYSEGTGNETLVFMSGGGTCSPILDFKSLYSLLSDDYKIVVVEKFGYGFSNVVNAPRDLDTMLGQTRAALQKAGHEGPYVLCPHSMSGLEALYWAQQYPDEVEAIVGLDMAVPQHYDAMDINIPLLKLGQYAAGLGVTRLLPGTAESDAIRHGTLTAEEKAIYRAVFHSRTATASMIGEAKAVKANAALVDRGGIPEVPLLLFISDGSGGTGFSTQAWRQIPEEYLSQAQNGTFIELDCPHYVHDYEYERISREIRAFLDAME